MARVYNKKGFTLMELIIASLLMLLLLGSLTSLLLLFMKWNNNRSYQEEVDGNNKILVTAITTNLNKYNGSSYEIDCSLNQLNLKDELGNVLVSISFNDESKELNYDENKKLGLNTIDNIDFSYQNNILTIIVNAYQNSQNSSIKEYRYTYYYYFKGVIL